MITSIALLVITVILVAEILAMQKRIKEVENVVYYQMDATHYPAIKNEFQTIWSAIEDLKSEENNENGNE